MAQATSGQSGQYGQYALLFLRLVVGIVFVLHGYPKWGSLGGTAQFFGSLGIPAPGLFAPIVAFVETVGGLALIVGVLTRYAGLLLAIDMIVAFLTFKTKIGFIAPMDKPGPPGGELDLLLLAGSLIIATLGPGAFSLTRMMGKKS
jgi:putative oxidoreductase